MAGEMEMLQEMGKQICEGLKSECSIEDCEAFLKKLREDMEEIKATYFSSTTEFVFSSPIEKEFYNSLFTMYVVFLAVAERIIDEKREENRELNIGEGN